MIIDKIILFCFIVTILTSKDLITPIPLNPIYDHKKALLGKKLFFDTRLSHNDTISCASCHILEDGGDDNIPISSGVDGKSGTRNSPTVLNARYNMTQFWDGRAKSLQDQAKDSILDPVKMGSNFQEIIIKLQIDRDYLDQFSALYEDGITGTNITDAIYEFEKTLTTPNSKYDKFLRGDIEALNSDELDGYRLFKEYGCISCHNGINIGGNLIQKIGIASEYNGDDLGRFNITNDSEDKFYFKVPSLRNIELTAPYLHDGETKTLKDTVLMMMRHQVGYLLKDQEVEKIIKFLKTLTGERPKLIRGNDEKNHQ